MTDTPPPLSAPPSPIDQFRAVVGDLARPYAIIVTSTAAAIATVILSLRLGVNEAAVFIGAVFFGVGALYGAKSLEVASGSKHAAQVEISKNTTP